MIRCWPAALVRAYPPGWRTRFSDEMRALIEDLADDGRPPFSLALNVLRGAAAAWLTDRRSPVPDRTIAALLAVLWSWTPFAATAAWFGKNAGEYPSAAVAREVSLAHPGLTAAYNVLLVAGVVGIVATGAAAIPFAAGAIRRAVAERSYRTLAQVATPPATAIAWLAGLKLIALSTSQGEARFVAESIWLLMGALGIAASTLAVSKVVCKGRHSRRTTQFGVAAAIAVTSAMLVGTAATFAWGLAAHPVRPGPGGGGAIGWILVVAVMMIASLRAAIALVSLRRRAAG